MIAGIVGNTRFGKLLIEHGADPDKVNDVGETPLSLAAHKGHAPFVELLLDRGASLECRPHGHSLESWVTKTSGLSPEKIATILRLLNHDQKAPERS
jgi:ankyrin repeat protein